MAPYGEVKHGDVIRTEDGHLSVAYRASRLHAPTTGLTRTDGELSADADEFGEAYRILSDDEVRAHHDRLLAILGAEHDALRFGRDHCEATGADEERDAYQADMEGLDDAARIILTK